MPVAKMDWQGTSSSAPLSYGRNALTSSSIIRWRTSWEMSRSLLNIAKRPLPRLTLRGVGLTSKDAVS